MPDEIEVRPNFEHKEPGFGVEASELGSVIAVEEKTTASVIPRTSGLLIRLM
jgi:hypothetical protein